MNKPEILWTSDDDGRLSTQIGPVCVATNELEGQDTRQVSLSTPGGLVMHLRVGSFYDAWKLAFAIREVVDYFNGDC